MGEPMHPSVEAVKESISAYNRGDFETLREFYAEDVVWHAAGEHSLSGDYRGRDALFAYFANVRALTAGTLKLEPQSIIVSDDEISMFTRVTAHRPGKRLDVHLTQTFKVGPDGKWTEYWALADDQDAVDDFWS
jgi:ketosteroid isomerase-like protein